MVAESPGEAEEGANLVYDAFVSYSRTDTPLASRLAKALEAYRPPKDLAVPQRHLRIFRDEQDFTGVDYYTSIERYLTSSGSLIVVCSPNARRSQYVNDEIRRFGVMHGPERIIPILCSGLPNNEAANGREEERAFPDALCDLMEMPLAVSYAGFDPTRDKVTKGAFENAWYSLLANLFGISRSELEQRDKRRQARQRRFWIVLVSAFVLSIIAGLAASLYQWRQAVIARDTAFSRELSANALGQVGTDPDLSVKLALEALRVSQTREAEAALREALVVNRVLAVMTGMKRMVSASLSADGRLLITGGYDRLLRLWRLETGELVAGLDGHIELIEGTAFSPDGRLAATASWDGTARVWDLPGQRLLHKLAHGKVPVNSVQFSPDGQFVATGAGDGTVRIWRSSDGLLVRKLDAHSWPKTIVYGVTRVAYSPDGTRLLSSAGDASTATGEPVARMWDAENGKLLREFAFPSGVVIASQFSADVTRVLVASDRSVAGVWEVAMEKLPIVFDEHTSTVALAAFSHDGTVALTADRTDVAVLWDAQTGKARAKLYGDITAVAFDSAGTKVATGGKGGARVWDARSGELLLDLRGRFADVTVLRFGAGGRRLITAGEDGTARVWDINSPPELLLSGLGGGSIGPEFSANGKWIMAESSTNVMVWDAWRGTRLVDLSTQGHIASINGRPVALHVGPAAFDRGNRLMVGDQRVSSPQFREVLAANGQPAFSVVHVPEFTRYRSRDERLTLIPQANYSAVVRERDSWLQVSELKGHKGSIGGAVFGPGSTWVLTASEDGSARVWDVKTGRQTQEFKLDNRGYAVRLSPDGRFACVVEDWASIKLWDTATWQDVHTFTWPAPQSGGNWAKVAEFSPDGTLLAVGDNSGVLHILDVAARKEQATVHAHKYKIDSLAFSADSRFIVTIGEGDRGAITGPGGRSWGRTKATT